MLRLNACWPRLSKKISGVKDGVGASVLKRPLLVKIQQWPSSLRTENFLNSVHIFGSGTPSCPLFPLGSQWTQNRNTLYPKTNLRHLETRVVTLGLACCARSAADRFMRSSWWRWRIVEYLLHSTSCLYFPRLCFVSSLVHLLSAADLSIRVSRVAADSAAFRSPVTQPVKLITVGPTAFTPPTRSHTHTHIRCSDGWGSTSRRYTPPGNGAEWDGAPCCSLWSSEWWFRPKTDKMTSPADIFSCNWLDWEVSIVHSRYLAFC